MTAARWGEIKSVLASVLEESPEERAAALERLCGNDHEMRREVESLLAFEKRAGVALDSDGDFTIDDVLSPLPASTCDTPVLLIRTAAGAHPWFAAGIED